MANVEGNEIALRSVLGQNLPAPRDGSDARSDNDARPAFITADYNLLPNYAESVAPSWCYGVTYEGAGGNEYPGADTGPIAVSWGTAAQPGSAESILYPGQTLSFPRAARRVFARFLSDPNYLVRNCKLTWKLDPYAAKTWSPGAAVSVVGANGYGINESYPWSAPFPSFVLAPRTQLMVEIRNTSTVQVNYQLVAFGFGTSLVVDTANIAAGGTFKAMYGPGIVVASLPAGFSGHCMTFPEVMGIFVLPAAPPGPGDTLGISYWYR